MRKTIGKIILPDQETSLKYDVFGNDTMGYSIEIVQGGKDIGKVVSNAISFDMESTCEFCLSLVKGVVFPRLLANILQDLEMPGILSIDKSVADCYTILNW